MKAQIKPTSQNQGFTILELMIATTVLSVILLLATAVMINIGTIYYKGDNQARIEDGVRAATDQVTQDIQFSSYAPDSGSATLDQFASGYPGSDTAYAFCMVSSNYKVRYSFVDNLQIGSNGWKTSNDDSQISHVLWRDQISQNDGCYPVDLTASDPEKSAKTTVVGMNGIELVAPNSRLLYFCVTNVAYTTPGCTDYGDNNFVITMSMAYGDPTLTTGGTCAGGDGDNFCATASLAARVTSRVH